MSDSSDTKSRRRWVTFGEIIAVAALIISALGLWITWQSTQNDQPTRVVEQKRQIVSKAESRAMFPQVI